MGLIRVGLLGGSFNPAHGGHRHISLLALKRLGLHEVWWLVTPQNPLKSRSEMAPFLERVRAAQDVARHPRIRVTDIEARLGTAHTADTLVLLKRRYPRCRFVWLMGADNLQQISAWKDWQRIFQMVPIAVFARPPYSRVALMGRSAHVFAPYRLPAWQAHTLAFRHPPAWVFLHTRAHSGSATRIRAGQAAAAGACGGLPANAATVGC